MLLNRMIYNYLLSNLIRWFYNCKYYTLISVIWWEPLSANFDEIYVWTFLSELVERKNNLEPQNLGIQAAATVSDFESWIGTKLYHRTRD